MNGLTCSFFAEFCGLALLAPALSALPRRITAKLLLPLGLPLLFTAPLLLVANVYFPDVSSLELLRLQLAACAFTVGLAGVTALLSRLWRHAGPLLTTILALAVLATPFWSNLLLDLASESVRAAALAALVNVNPLLAIARETQFDWTHGNVLYHLTRLGEDFAYTPPALRWVSLGYAAVGLVAAAVSGMLRQRGRPSDFGLDAAHF